MDTSAFTKSAVLQYHKREKLVSGILLLAAGILIAAFIICYILIIRHSEFFLVQMLNTLIGSVKTEIFSFSLIGSLLAAFFGGLFFVWLPMEVLFVSFIVKNEWYFVIPLFLLGYALSYTINYYIGYRFYKIAKQIITAKQFYNIKGKVNKYGPWAIFFINVLPLPSQALSAILGVLRYNRTKFYVYFLSGQLAKLLFLSLSNFFF